MCRSNYSFNINSQDIRHIGGVIIYIPYTRTCFCISNLSLCGLPFMSGFYSRDIILEYLSFTQFNFYRYLIFYVSVGFTVLYTVRILYYSFYGCINIYYCQRYYKDKYIIFPIVFLSIISLLMGRILCWFIFPNPSLLIIPLIINYIALIFILMGIYFGYILNNVNYTCNIFALYNIIWFLGDIWFIPKFSTYIIYIFSMNYSNNYNIVVDKGWGEYLISTILYQYSIYISKYISYYQYNNIKYYILSFIIIILIFFF